MSLHSKSKAKVTEPESSSDDLDDMPEEAYNDLGRKIEKLRFRKNSNRVSSSKSKGTRNFKKKTDVSNTSPSPSKLSKV